MSHMSVLLLPVTGFAASHSPLRAVSRDDHIKLSDPLSLWWGWLGLNGGGEIKWGGWEGADEQLPLRRHSVRRAC